MSCISCNSEYTIHSAQGKRLLWDRLCDECFLAAASRYGWATARRATWHGRKLPKWHELRDMWLFDRT